MREVRQEEEEEHRCAERILIGLEVVVENDTEEYFSVVLVVGVKTPSDGDISPTSSLHRLM